MAALLTQVSVFQRKTLLLQKVLPPGEYIIGRDVEAHISVPANGVCAQHAMLSLNFNEWVVEDLGGGTCVNGELITDARIVFPTQKIGVGDATILLHRLKDDDTVDESMAPQTAAVRKLLPQEIRGEHKYEIGPVVARGGMGVIVDAHEVPVRRNVAMKLIRDAARRVDIERFVREAQVTAQLEHPNIVPVHELGVNELDQPFYTMKYVHGVSLGKVLALLRHGDPTTVARYPLSALLTVFQKICDAIAFSHSKRVIHRDLKPDNIMLGEYGEVLVMDWGLAKVIGDESASSEPFKTQADNFSSAATPVRIRESPNETEAGTIIGTLQYMPPEQACGDVQKLDERCDVYSLGAILHHILTLRPPIEGKNHQEVLENVCAGRIRPLTDAADSRERPHLSRGHVPISLRAVVRKAMASHPQHRYESVPLLQADLAAYQAGFATSAEQAGAWKLVTLFLHRHRTISFAVAAILLAGLVFTVNLAVARVRAERAETVATQQRDGSENHLYVSDMLQAGTYIAEGLPDSARELLARHHSEVSGRDLRGWEWFHLDSQLSQDCLRVHAHSGGVYALAATSDGKRIATGGGDGDIAVWRTRGLAPDFRLRSAHHGIVLSVAWQRDGPLLASGGSDGMVRIWDTRLRQQLAEIRVGDGGEVRTVAWQPLPDGSGGVAIGGLEKTVYFWHPLNGHGKSAPPPEALFGVENGTSSLHWSADGLRLAVGKLDAKAPIEVFDITSHTMILSDRPHAGDDALCVAMSPSGAYIAAGSKHLAVVVFDVAKRELLFDEAIHRGFVRALAWSRDGKQLASASEDGTIRVFEPADPEAVPQIFSGHIGEVDALAWTRMDDPENTDHARDILLSGGSDGSLRVWTPNVIEQMGVASSNWIASARWSPDNSHIAMVNFRSHVYLIDVDSGLSIRICSAFAALFDVAWSPDGTRLLAASRQGGAIEMLDARSGRSLGVFAAPEAARVAWSPSGKYFAAAGAAGTRSWDAESGREVAVISRPTGSLAWLSDDRHVVLGGEDGAIEKWDALTGTKKEQWRAPQPVPPGSISLAHDAPCEVFDVALSPDGQFLAFGTMNKVAGVLDARAGRVGRAFLGHAGGVRGVAWSPDGKRLATCSHDGSARIYNVETGELVARIDHGRHGKELHAVDWSSDGKKLVTGGYDQMVRIWDATRSFDAESLQQLRGHSDGRLRDFTLLRELGERSAQLGSADRARQALAEAQEVAPDNATFHSANDRVEEILARAPEGRTPGPEPASQASPRQPADVSLLATIHSQLDENQIDAAVNAFQALLRSKGKEAVLPFARTYFSRAQWNVTWFGSRIEPQTDIEAWRAQASGDDAITIPVRALSFPYRSRPPKDLSVDPRLTSRGPDAAPFGMIARATFPIGNGKGKWRFAAKGDGGVRVLVDGKVLIEKWTNSGAFEGGGDYQPGDSAQMQIVVEHYAPRPVADFQLTIEPAPRVAALPGIVTP